MVITNRQLKQAAKQALSGKWLIAAAMVIVSLSICFSSGFFSRADGENILWFCIFYFIAVGVYLIFHVGFLNFLFKISCGQRDTAAFQDLLFGFHCHPGKTITLALLHLLYMIPGVVIVFVLLFLFIAVTFFGSGLSSDAFSLILDAPSETYDPALFIMLIFLILFMTAYMLYVNATYAMSYPVLLDYPDLTAREIRRRCARFMRGNRLRYIGLQLSFLPWMLLCALTLFLAYPWLKTYICAAQVQFYLDIVSQKTRN